MKMKLFHGTYIIHIIVSIFAIFSSILVTTYYPDSGIGRSLRSFVKSSPRNLTVSFSMKIPKKEDLKANPRDADRFLQENFYRESCPRAVKIVRNSMRRMYHAKSSIAPSLVRLVFHDCFIGGCDASVLLDSDKSFLSEKEAAPNLSLKGFDVIDSIKSELEEVCPGVVSCADIIVLAARESVELTGGPSYFLKTGRRDSMVAFKEAAGRELPAPTANLSTILSSFASRGFTPRETVALLGAHSIGITHCNFFQERLYNFSGTGKADPELNPRFLQDLKTKCPFAASTSSASPYAADSSTRSLHASNSQDMVNSNVDKVVDLSFDNEGGNDGFGVRYYKGLLHKKGVMFSDSQLMAKEETEKWVRQYASDKHRFRKDFSMAMTKLSNNQILTGNVGQVRIKCSKIH
ncbi:hypothetical protein CARUB_v10004951mg [Capsella rubella]|uniref:Peroxidase n=1 Tax=Capsella rubella TaxID=81985 RepID=R0GFN6_9BRAS|nr:putative Peroxidase 48 [Capsella rubella]EOA15534.1 hypothetical protein CARUB_v10004951mg [Capsella rubella]